MQIVLNGEKKEISENISLKQLIDRLELKQERVALELNKTVARRKDWAEIMLKDGDQLEIVHFVGGG
ncbi:MAG: sulfur carrier protein ThiS [Blastocatellia bacterium]|nr:sulfur carrier protein ThiS [Blastocatellia bacterium]MBL8194271.1 sulfur carrier protein ThiS [Blastocatellia bacterium]